MMSSTGRPGMSDIVYTWCVFHVGAVLASSVEFACGSSPTRPLERQVLVVRPGCHQEVSCRPWRASAWRYQPACPSFSPFALVFAPPLTNATHMAVWCSPTVDGVSRGCRHSYVSKPWRACISRARPGCPSLVAVLAPIGSAFLSRNFRTTAP